MAVITNRTDSPLNQRPFADSDILFAKKTRQAAVSIVLRPGKKDTEALFILRATKDGDPWSGQMAFPGGHYEVTDESLRRTCGKRDLGGDWPGLDGDSPIRRAD